MNTEYENFIGYDSEDEYANFDLSGLIAKGAKLGGKLLGKLKKKKKSSGPDPVQQQKMMMEQKAVEDKAKNKKMYIYIGVGVGVVVIGIILFFVLRKK